MDWMIDKNKELQQKTKTHNGDSERAWFAEKSVDLTQLQLGFRCVSYAVSGLKQLHKKTLI